MQVAFHEHLRLARHNQFNGFVGRGFFVLGIHQNLDGKIQFEFPAQLLDFFAVAGQGRFGDALVVSPLQGQHDVAAFRYGHGHGFFRRTFHTLNQFIKIFKHVAPIPFVILFISADSAV